jgi:hypothetical protein
MDSNQTPLGREPLAAEYLRKNSVKDGKGIYWMSAENQRYYQGNPVAYRGRYSV